MTDSLNIRRDAAKGKIYSQLRRKWLVETPEETVRQEYLLVLVNEYGFALEQIAEEIELTGRGSASARADFVIWRAAHDKAADNAPFIIVECKSDSVTIKPQDYSQGENYARICGAPFFVTHNSRETRYWRVKKDKLPGYTEEIENIPHGGASDKDIEELLAKLRTFKEKEFADLLHQCHNVIRNREKKDPAAAFDEIAKVLFIKVYVERQLLSRRSRENLFTVDVLNRQIAENPLDTLFQQTKLAYAADKIFEADERINLKPATGEEIVRKLEKYNLSDTSEDVKGVAFERFLGRTFRGEIGQFFTPRTIVEFMVHMIDPQEGEIVCDPASGSGGFLIRVFEIVREKILAAADQEYSVFKAETEADSSLTPELRAKLLQSKFSELRAAVDQQRKDSRLWKLSNRCIYGTDANDRMARTSKMNMIMHGDGHGGVHHHDGFLNVNGIFEGRFDIILTNPPFGANVEPSDKVLEENLSVSPEAAKRYFEEYGDLYTEAQNRVKAALNKPIASLFDLPKSDKAKIKTEVLFIERCLDLLKPGGRLAVVLPEGIFNNPSLAYVREFVENRAFIRAVVSLPQETFVSSGASVKCSLLFLQKFTEAEQQRFEETLAAAKADAAAHGAEEAEKEQARLEAEIAAAKQAKDADRRKALQKELKDFLNQAEARQAAEARRRLKERLDYPIFMYEAEKVGITATGEEEQNELYPNANQPAGCEKTCLEWYREFRADMEGFGEEKEGRQFFFAVRFSNLERWDTAYYRSVNWQWPKQYIQPLGKALKRIQSLVQIDPVSLPIIEKISFGGELSILDEEKRAGYKGRLFKAESGQLIYSKIRVKQGSVCIVPSSVDWVAVSSEYPVYVVKQQIADAKYLELVLRSSSFKHYLEGLSHGGSTKTRIHPDQFEKITVPLPPLPVQRKIVEHWEKATAQCLLADDAIKKIQNELETHLLGCIGITVPPVIPRNGRFTIKLSQNDRWDTLFFREDFVLLEKQIKEMPHVPIGNALNFISRSWNIEDFKQNQFKYIEISSVNKDEGITQSRLVEVNEAPSRATTLVKDGDLIISTTRPYLGSFAIVNKRYNNCVCSSGFSLADSVKNDKLKKEFVLFFLKSPAGLRQMERRMSGGLYPAIVQSELEKILLPVPPLELQNKIIAEHQEGQNELARLRTEKIRIKIETVQSIEQMIIGTVPL